MIPTVVVTCTKRKRFPIAPSLHLRSLKLRDVEKRCAAWIERLKSDEIASRSVKELYAGEHWQVASELRATVYVISAGYGLVPTRAQMKPYAATFSHRDPDSVVFGSPTQVRDATRETWWATMGIWTGPVAGEPRTLEELARRSPQTPLIVVASEPYLRACASDLLRAAKLLASKDLLMLVSAGARLQSSLAPYLLPADARLQHSLGGTRQALNARIAHYLLTAKGEPFRTATRARKTLTKELGRMPAIKHYDRRTLTDDEVKDFIKSQLRVDSTARAHPLLRRLRDQGFACEQSRFSSLHRDVREELGYA